MSDYDAAGEIWATMDKVRNSMFTTEEEGELHSRPMAAYPARDEHAIYFVSRTDHKVREIEGGSPVNLSFSDNSNNTWVSVFGHARVSQDRTKLRELWSNWAEAYLPQGPDAPDVALITVTPVSGKIWDSASSKLVQVAKTLVASARQVPPKDTVAETAL